MSNPGKMSGGGSSRVSIPSSLRKTIQDIKEIAGNHSDEVILAMLEECSMDPNETAQKLLFQDTFHEVKRKRDKRKENLNNREPTDSRWKPGTQGRGIRGGRGSYSRYLSHDSGGINTGKEDGIIQVMEKGIMPSSSFSTQETEHKSGVPASSSVSGFVNAPIKVGNTSSSQGSGSEMAGDGCFPVGEEGYPAETTKAGRALLPSVDTKNDPANVVGVIQTSDQFSSMMSQIAAVEPAIGKVMSREVSGSEISSEKSSLEMANYSLQESIPAKSQGLDVSHLPDAPQPLSSTFQSGSSGSMPSSNFSSRSQPLIGPQKVGPSKEWKPKSVNQIPAQASGTISTSDTAHAEVEKDTQSVSVVKSGGSEVATAKLQKKLEELQFSDSRHVIIPNHLQVPEAERSGLSFGSFDGSFGIGTRSAFPKDADNEKSSTPLSESSEGPEENIEELTSSSQNVSSTAQEDPYPEHPSSPSQMRENLSTRESDISLNISDVPEYEQSKQFSAVSQGSSQFPVVHTAPYSAFGLIPPGLGSQLAPFENSEPLAREASRVSSFIVQQPFDASTNYYTQIYRPGADGDGRFSPFLGHGAATKHSGNMAILSSPTGQLTQESENSLVLPTTGIATQAGGAIQTSVAVNQQPVPFFRQPAGVHLSHFPPNYMPYGHYVSPFYVPATAIHHFYSNTGFPQQPLAGGMYPPPAAAATTHVKYSLPQYKSGTNSGNSTHAVLPTGHGPYSSSPTGYSSSPPVSSGNSTANEDHSVSQYKENNVYITGQQSEGSAVWIPAPGRDIPSMQAGSFFNLPQGQHMTFAQPQAGNGAFAGIYHPPQSVGAATVHPMLQPSQTMAGGVEMAGAPAGVYQQPQRAQINWASNY
uniref:GBF-interacting protein 1 N-terminal domain-containing protein n=1 Tax=Anthurium amnicola TaxID=1678845 RepID=A0A1D1YBU7_9ARAE